MSTILSICNQKGGVGKSTTAVNLSAYLALAGRRTLLIDLDSQGNATTACGIQRGSFQQHLYHVITNGIRIESVIIKTGIELLEIVPSAIDLAGAEPYLTQMEASREGVLKHILYSIRERYDFIVLDCPPALGLLTVNAWVASDSVLIPVQCEYLALEGLTALMRAIDLVKQRLNQELRVSGILMTMTDFRANLSREVAEELKGFFKELVFNTSIPRNIRLAEAPSFGKPICLYDPNSTGALAYRLVAQEVIEKEAAEKPAGVAS